MRGRLAVDNAEGAGVRGRRPAGYWLTWAGFAFAVAAAMLTTARLRDCGEERYRKEMAIHEDFYRIYTAASHATWRDVPRWWVGPWIYPGVGYYRPVTSMLFLAEQRLFDRRFNSYNRVTWGLHGLNAGLVTLLTVSLLRHRLRWRVPLGVLAAIWFTDAGGPYGFALPAAIQWWPAQNDPLSALFGLGCLVLLDRYLVTGRRAWLGLALAALVFAIGAKEMGHAAAVMAIALIGYRRGRLSWAMAPFAAVSVGLYLLRLIVVPNPWMLYPTWPMAMRKALVHLMDPFGMQALRQEWWPILAAALVVALASMGLRQGRPLWQIGVACMIAPALVAQLAGGEGGWALPLEPSGFSAYWGDLMYFAAIVLLWTYRRRQPAMPAVVFYLMSLAPVLGVVGTYYYYWAAAFRSVLIAVVCACALDLAYDLWSRGGQRTVLGDPKSGAASDTA